MARIPLLLSLLFIFFMACDPKVDQRSERFNDTDCPTCNATGVCHSCKGTKECVQCHGTGERTISTENYGGEGLKLDSYTVECPFCNGDKTCHTCDATGQCLQCDGDGKIESNWKTITQDPRLVKSSDTLQQSTTNTGESNE